VTVSPRIEQLLIHPPFKRAFHVSEHPEGELEFPGDALGCDCIVAASMPGKGFRTYRNTGERNDDWFGWQAEVLAPFDGVVERVQSAMETNLPGQPSTTPPGLIIFLHDDRVRCMFGHLDEIVVQEGERVQAGQQVASVGNNGYSWYPHLHIGAWRDDVPLQIRFDLRVLGRLRAKDTHHFYGTSP
jgi:hypothetical protein